MNTRSAAVIVAMLLPGSPFLGEDGSVVQSMVVKFVAIFISVIFAVLGIVYGRVTGSLPKFSDVPPAMAEGVRTLAPVGVDRDSALMASAFDERDPAVLHLLGLAIDACRRQGKYVGICGQGPSDHPEFAKWLVARGIQSLSLNPDTVVETWLALAVNETPAAQTLTRTHLIRLS